MKILLLKNLEGNPSYTTTMIVVAFFIINLKLLISGIQITDKFKMSDFSGTDYASCLAAISGLHLFDKKLKQDGNKDA